MTARRRRLLARVSVATTSAVVFAGMYLGWVIQS